MTPQSEEKSLIPGMMMEGELTEQELLKINEEF